MKLLVDISSTMLIEMWRLCAEMAPYLLFGMLVSGLITVFIDSQFIYKHIGSKDFKSIFKSTIFGVPLPLCSCGVIPVAATLRDSGASKGSTVSFLVSTPQTGIDSIFLTYGLLGPVIAVFRPLAAIFSGFLSGIIINRFDNDIHHQTKSAPTPSKKQTTLIQKINKGIVYGFKTLPSDIATPLFQGLVIAALISLLIPPELITDYFSTNTFIQFLFILGISIPFYVCATASIPIAVALMAKGISPGAAFVFLMAGPATNASSIAIIKKILGKKTLYYYIALISITAIFFGIVLDLFFLINNPPNILHHHHSMDLLTTITTSIFILIFVNVYLSKFLKKDTKNFITKSKERGYSLSNIKVKVGGMTCSHCKESVENAVLSVEGVENTSADVKKGEVSIFGYGIDISSIKNKIESRGFTVLN